MPNYFILKALPVRSCITFLRKGNHLISFTLIELLVIIGIISILASMLLPVLTQSKATAKSIQCTNNLKQLLAASILYSNDYDDYIEPVFTPIKKTQNDTNHWIGLLQGYLGRNDAIFSSSHDLPSAVCPMSPKRFGYGHNYLYLGWHQDPNFNSFKLTWFKNPADVAHLCDNIIPTSADPNQFMSWQPFVRSGGFPLQDVIVYFVHHSKTNVGWLDGHVSSRLRNDGFVKPGALETDRKWWGKLN